VNASQGKKTYRFWRAKGSFHEMLPEVAALRDLQQANAYHSEGDPFVHTMLVIEAVTEVADQRVFRGVLPTI
jgi:hypothetical protein